MVISTASDSGVASFISGHSMCDLWWTDEKGQKGRKRKSVRVKSMINTVNFTLIYIQNVYKLWFTKDVLKWK